MDNNAKPLLWSDVEAAERESGRERRLTLFGELWNVERVADFLSVSRGSIYRWVESGTLDAFRLPGGGIRVSGAHLRRFLNGDGASTVEAEREGLRASGWDGDE